MCCGCLCYKKFEHFLIFRFRNNNEKAKLNNKKKKQPKPNEQRSSQRVKMFSVLFEMQFYIYCVIAGLLQTHHNK